MKKILLPLLTSLFLLSLNACGQEIVNHTIGDLTPKYSKGEIVKHTYYTLSYSEENEQPYWVFYKLTPDFLNSSIDRTDDFRPDPSVSSGSAALSDYSGSGYDRGHLAPAADMKINDTSISESFFLSNMSPQLPGFNRGIWSKLESLVRTWCTNEDTIYVVTGPVFKNNIGTIGANQVTIPGYYYKAILDITDERKMIALVLPNASSSADLSSFVISIDSLESLTGIDFFPGLPDNIETTLEKKSNASQWTWTSTVSSTNPTTKSGSVQEKSTGSTQCLGTASSTGQQCKNMTTNTNGYCHVHQNQAPGYVKPASTGYAGQCCATTKAGTRCKRQASDGTKYCWQHQ
jgi:endonuclease G